MRVHMFNGFNGLPHAMFNGNVNVNVLCLMGTRIFIQYGILRQYGMRVHMFNGLPRAIFTHTHIYIHTHLLCKYGTRVPFKHVLPRATHRHTDTQTDKQTKQTRLKGLPFKFLPFLIVIVSQG
jgi:hypothetical protein